MSKNLWKIPEVGSLRTPKGLMEEQAANLARLTNGLLAAEVRQGRVVGAFGGLGKVPDGADISFSFDVVAPVLNGYRVRLFEVRQPSTMYPLKIISDVAKVRRGDVSDLGAGDQIRGECASGEEFEEVLGEILSSEPVQEVIGALLAQSR